MISLVTNGPYKSLVSIWVRNVLTVRAERRSGPGRDVELIAAERPRGVFSRQVLLGDALDTARIEASYEAGVLRLVIPVAEKAKPRKITVTSSDTERQQVHANNGADRHAINV